VQAGAASDRRPRSALPGTRSALALGAVALATVAVGIVVETATSSLGAPLAPFFATLSPRIDPAAALALPAYLLAAAAAVALARSSTGTGRFLAGCFGVALAARLGLATARDGLDGLYAVLGPAPEGANEYLPALPALHSLGVHAFLDRFAEISPTLPIHPSAHPPGILLLLDALGIDGPRAFAALVIAVGAGAAPLTYVLARRLALDEGRARLAALLIALSPAAMLYGVTSTDALYATLGLGALCLLAGSQLLPRVLGGLALAVASFFSWALLALGAFAAVVVALREGPRSAIVLSLVVGVALVAFYGVLHAAFGFDPIGAVRAAGDAYDLGISNARPYIFWLFGSPVAYAVALGLPTAWFAARALGAGNEVAIGLAAIIAVSVLIGLTKAETERIWLFMGPLAAVAAATLLPARRMPLVLGALAAQGLAAALLLDTIW